MLRTPAPIQRVVEPEAMDTGLNDSIKLERIDAKALPFDARSFFDASMRAAFTIDEARALAAALNIPPDSVERTSDRRWALAYKGSSDG